MPTKTAIGSISRPTTPPGNPCAAASSPSSNAGASPWRHRWPAGPPDRRRRPPRAGRRPTRHYDGGVSSAFTATPITAAPEHLTRVKYDAAGLVPAIIQEAATGAVLMLAYMNDDAL